ncbi:MAG TPA: CHAD domain-containing protein [Vicinamibacterales bacterium]|nr:CHAD domain-containing protein [Vicinamibacterales bacterium]
MKRTNPSELLIRQRLSALSRTLPGARKGDAHAVHQARVATRRLREALPLVVRGRSGKTLARKVRRVTRALGPVRELDVALLNLEQLRSSGDVPDTAIARLRLVITEERQRLSTEMVRRIGQWSVEKVQKKALAAVQRDVPVTGRRTRDPRRITAAQARAARRAVALQAAIENAASIYLPDRLHEVRIAVKKLRYALEVARDLSGSRATVRILTLKRAQDLLGRMHDLEMLIARTRAVQTAGTPNLSLSGDLDRLVRRLEMECRRLHVRYMNERKALRAIGDYVTALETRNSRASAA